MSPKTKKDRINSLTLRKNLNKLVFERLRNRTWLSLVHPLLFAIFPILFIYSNNLEELFLSEIVGPILISLTVTVFIFIIFNRIYKDVYKSALITSASLVIFFSYGHIFDLIEGYEIFGFLVGRNMFLLPLTAISFFIIFILILRSRFNPEQVSKILSFIASVLISISLINIISYGTGNGLQIFGSKVLSHQKISRQGEGEFGKPDIYYIILDGYASGKTLKQVFGFDNSDFYDSLESRGFYIAKESRSNYQLSYLSLASSLEMSYLNYLPDKSINDQTKKKRSYKSLWNGKVIQSLKSHDYTFINIGTGWGVTDNNPYADYQVSYGQRNEFTKIIYSTSMLLLFERFQNDAANSILFAFDTLEEIPNVNGPTFTFAHIMSPHPPYLFDKKGNMLNNQKGIGVLERWKQKEKYIEQLIFVNSKTIEMVDALLSKSGKKPIIIIQSDHGPATMDQFLTDIKDLNNKQMEERLGILNVYYLPEGGSKDLYQNVTPVNSFRKILNFYFDEQLKQLKDESYVTQYENFHEYRIFK